jgi:hypothetical protein
VDFVAFDLAQHFFQTLQCPSLRSGIVNRLLDERIGNSAIPTMFETRELVGKRGQQISDSIRERGSDLEPPRKRGRE